MKGFKKYINEGIGVGGLAYEAKVRKSVIQTLKNRAFSKDKRITLKPDSAGGFASNVVDMYLTLDGKDVPVEIKMDKDAQMGGPSVKINKGKPYGLSKAGEDLEDDVREMIINAVKSKERPIRNYIKQMKTLEPIELHKQAGVYEVPFKTTKEAWAILQKKGLLKPINTIVKYNTKFIHDWYARKKCYYIQIGKLGMFYLQKNPLGLKIPQLKADIEIYVRLTRSGSGGTKAYPTQRSSQIRAIASLKVKGGKSPLSLDNPKDVEEIFNQMMGK